MDFKRLEDNIVDVIKEQQAKLGYRKEIIRLYYPLSSLNHLAGSNLDVKEMSDALKLFAEYTSSRLGNIKSAVNNDRFCLEIPQSGSEYVHDNTSENEFIVKLVDIMSKPGCTMEQIIQYFKDFSENVVIRKVDNEDFDYVMFFEQSEDNNASQQNDVNQQNNGNKQNDVNQQNDENIQNKENQDKYIYCFKDEGCHVIYHRFLPDDYKDLFEL